MSFLAVKGTALSDNIIVPSFDRFRKNKFSSNYNRINTFKYQFSCFFKQEKVVSSIRTHPTSALNTLKIGLSAQIFTLPRCQLQRQGLTRYCYHIRIGPVSPVALKTWNWITELDLWRAEPSLNNSF